MLELEVWGVGYGCGLGIGQDKNRGLWPKIGVGI